MKFLLQFRCINLIAATRAEGELVLKLFGIWHFLMSLLPTFLQCVVIMLKMWKYLVTEHQIHPICIFTKQAPPHRIKIVENIQISLKNSQIIIWQIIAREIWRTLKFKHKGGKNNYIQWNWMMWKAARPQLKKKICWGINTYSTHCHNPKSTITQLNLT